MRGPSEHWLDGKVCAVTGANAGVGRATALELARLGARVILLCRSRARGEEARRAIVQSTGNERVEVVCADLSSQREIREAAAEIMGRHDSLHVLVNNAAVYTRERATSEDGIELQLAVNHLAPFLLTRLLLPLLQRSAPARVITVSSEAHRRTTMRWDDLQGQRGYIGLRAYAQSKLANVLFTLELARRLEGAGVTANAAHPGVVGTQLLFGGWAPLRLLRRFLRTPEEGARTSVYLAAAPELQQVSGAYFKDCRPIAPSLQARDPGAARRLWEESERLVGLA